MVNPATSQRGCVTVPIISPAELSESNFFMRRKRGVDGARPLSGGFFTQDRRKKKFLRRNSDGDINHNSDDGWVTASADEDFDDDEEEVDDNATLLRNASKENGADCARPRTLRFTRDTSILAPEPCPEMAGVPRTGEWQGEPTLLRHRQGGRLEPWEAVRRRRIALPDTPHTAHSIMFLNHQPGETSDFTETLQRNSKGGEKLEQEISVAQGEDTRVDRFPMQFGQWDGVEGYASGTLPSARNIVDGLRRREEENELKSEKKKGDGEKITKERLYKPKCKARPFKCNIKTADDQFSETSNSPNSSSSEANNSTSLLNAKSLEPEQMKSLSNSTESLKSQTQSGLRRRSGNSRLPPLPTLDVTGSSPIGSPPTSPSVDNRSGTLDPALVIEEDVESLAETSSLYDDHVYDVPSEVKARADNDCTSHQSDEDIASFSAEVANLDEPCFTNEPRLEKKDSLEEILPDSPSDASLFDTNSLAYNFYPNNRTTRHGNNKYMKHHSACGDSNTESYIYNGSLFSVVSSDSDAGSALYYHRDKFASDKEQHLRNNPAAILRSRLKTGDGSIYGRPIIFMMGGKPIVFSESSPYQTDNESVAKESLLNDSVSMSFRQDPERGYKPQPVTMPVMESSPLTVDVGKEHNFSCVPQAPHTVDVSSFQCDCENCHNMCSMCPDSTRLVPLDPSTKLKLWDLRLICLNREENQYSTYPPRRPTLDDRGVGPLDAADSLHYISTTSSKRGSRVFRHRSDVSTDQYVTRKINRLLRAPVITLAELPPMPSEMSSPTDVKDPAPPATQEALDFPTAGLRSLYRSFLGEEDSESSPQVEAGWSMYPTKQETLDASSVKPVVPACLNPYRSVMATDTAMETATYPAIFAKKEDKIQLNGWRKFFTQKISQADRAWPGSGTDEDAILSGCPKPLPVDWPFMTESNLFKGGAESGDETDDSVYIYKPLGFFGMYGWGRGRSEGEESSSSNISSDDVGLKRNHHYCKRRRGHHHHHHHRAQRHLGPAFDKSHVNSLLLKKKISDTRSNGGTTNSADDKQEFPEPHTSPGVALMTSDGDEDSSSIYNASIRSGASSSVYYGGTSNLSTSTSLSNLQNTNNNNIDGISGGSSSDSNNKMSLVSSKSLLPGKSSGKIRKSGTDRSGNQVIWGDASIVDWRRQAAKFRDNNFITLIL